MSSFSRSQPRFHKPRTDLNPTITSSSQNKGMILTTRSVGKGSPTKVTLHANRSSTKSIPTTKTSYTSKSARSTSRVGDSVHTVKTSAHSNNIIESEYIKNLRQHVYYLELETNFLREELRKVNLEKEDYYETASDLQNQLNSLRIEWESREETLSSQLRQRELDLQSADSDRKQSEEQARREHEAYSRELSELRRSVEEMEAGLGEKDRDIEIQQNQLRRLHDMEAALAHAKAEHERETHRKDSRLQQLSHEASALKQEVHTKGARIAFLETNLREVEEQLREAYVTAETDTSNSWKEENAKLRLQLQQKEISLEQEKHMRRKTSEIQQQLAQENAELSAQISALRRELEREKRVLEDKQSRRHEVINELTVTRDKKDRLEIDNEQLRMEVTSQQQHLDMLLDEISKKDEEIENLSGLVDELRLQVDTVKNLHTDELGANSKLRLDKSLLMSQVTEAHNAASDEVHLLRNQVADLKKDRAELMKQLQYLKGLSSIRWGDLEHLAAQVQDFTHKMDVNELQ